MIEFFGFINTLNNALYIDKSATYGSNNQIGLLSYLGRVNYAYKSKYLLSLSLSLLFLYSGVYV